MARFAAASICVLVLSSGVATAEATQGAWRPGPPRYGVHTIHDVAFPMSDGAVLYGEVSYPIGLRSSRRPAREFPVLLAVNPYNIGGLSSLGEAPLPTELDYFVEHGYIAVVVDARGTGRSGGVDEFLSPRAQRDGAELIQFVAHGLDGSNGDVGLIGCSYLGEWALFNAANADAAGPSPVKAAVPQCASGVFFREFFNVGGIMTSEWYMGEGLFAAADASPLSSQPTTTVTNVLDHSQSLYRHLVASTTGTLLGGDRGYEGKWWRDRSPLYRARDIVRNRIPTLLFSSYNDVFPEGALEMFTALQNLERGLPAFGPLSPDEAPLSPRHQIVMGPGAHASGISPEVSLRWLDEWVKGEDTGIADTNRPIHLWHHRTEGWVDTDRYPVVDRYTPLYLDEGGALTSSASNGEGSDALGWAPADAGGSLAYETAPLRKTATVAGPSSATIYATSTRPEVQLIATLSDVAPDGTVTAITKAGALIGSQRATRAQRNWVDARGRMIRPYHPLSEGSEEAVPAGTITRYDIEIPPTVWELAPGHRLRLTLSSQSSVLVPNVKQLAALAGGEYSIRRGAEARSVLNVPLIFQRSRSVLRPTTVDWDAGAPPPPQPAPLAAPA